LTALKEGTLSSCKLGLHSLEKRENSFERMDKKTRNDATSRTCPNQKKPMSSGSGEDGGTDRAKGGRFQRSKKKEAAAKVLFLGTVGGVSRLIV